MITISARRGAGIVPAWSLVLLVLVGCQTPRTTDVTYFIPASVPAPSVVPGLRGSAKEIVAYALPRVRAATSMQELELSMLNGVNIERDGRNGGDTGSGWVLRVFTNRAQQVGTVAVTSKVMQFTFAPLGQNDTPLPPWSVDSDAAIRRADPGGRYPRYVLLLGGYVGDRYNDPAAPVLWQVGDGTRTSGFTDFVDANKDALTNSSGKLL